MKTVLFVACVCAALCLTACESKPSNVTIKGPTPEDSGADKSVKEKGGRGFPKAPPKK